MGEQSAESIPSRSSTVRGEDAVRVYGSASLSNLGPGYDTLGLCIRGLGDVVEARATGTGRVEITGITGDDGALPQSPTENTATRAARWVLDRAGSDRGIELEIQKGIPLGSGIGGSAASAVAGAWAANLLLEDPLPREELVEAVLTGESGADGARHGDNVLPALFGGLVLVSSSDPSRYRRVAIPAGLHLALVLPRIEVLTREAREILPEQVGLADAVHNASQVAFLLEAMRAGDWAEVGDLIMTDRLVEPVRARLVSSYQAIRDAALEAGAYGCALSGSGPALFAVVEGPDRARLVARAMAEASESAGVPAGHHAVEADLRGVRRIDEAVDQL